MLVGSRLPFIKKTQCADQNQVLLLKKQGFPAEKCFDINLSDSCTPRVLGEFLLPVNTAHERA